MAFQWVAIYRRIDKVVVSLWSKSGNMKMVVDMETNATHIIDGTSVIFSYADPLEAHKDKRVLEYFISKYGMEGVDNAERLRIN